MYKYRRSLNFFANINNFEKGFFFCRAPMYAEGTGMSKTTWFTHKMYTDHLSKFPKRFTANPPPPTLGCTHYPAHAILRSEN